MLDLNYQTLKKLNKMTEQAKYNKTYRLKVDIPQSNAGRLLRADTVSGEIKYYFVKKRSEETPKWSSSDEYGYEKHGDTIFSLEEIRNEKFFEPIGEWVDLFPKFPSIKKLEEYLYLVGETRLVSSVDFIRAVGPVFYSEEYKNACYKILKEMYENKYFNQK